MINAKELINREYDGKIPQSFQYKCIVISNENNKIPLTFDFHVGMESDSWSMRVIIERTSAADHQVYNIGYTMPKSGLPLELIAATGLSYFRMFLQKELDYKMSLMFSLSDIVQGM